MANTGTRLVEKFHFVTGLSNLLPSTTTPAYVSMRGWNHLTVVITVRNVTTVTGSAITLKQATDIANAGSDEKTLAFDTMWANIDTAASDVLVKTAVTSNTFTTDTTNSKLLKYIIEVDAESLDVDGGFDCVRAGTGNAVANVVNIEYILSGQRFGGQTSSQVTAVTN